MLLLEQLVLLPLLTLAVQEPKVEDSIDLQAQLRLGIGRGVHLLCNVQRFPPEPAAWVLDVARRVGLANLTLLPFTAEAVKYLHLWIREFLIQARMIPDALTRVRAPRQV